MARPESDLREVYAAAIALTDQIGQAIADNAWDELNALLQDRERFIKQAQAILDDLEQRAHPDLAQQLRQLQQADARHMLTLQEKRNHMQQQIEGLQMSRTALSGYRDALVSGEIEPHFLDRDR